MYLSCRVGGRGRPSAAALPPYHRSPTGSKVSTNRTGAIGPILVPSEEGASGGLAVVRSRKVLVPTSAGRPVDSPELEVSL